MRLVMAGLDYTTAGVGVRGAFAPDAAALGETLRAVASGAATAADGVAGCALVATCNRTELYASYRGDVPPDCARLLCERFGRDPREHRAHFIERYERQAVEHLMRVASGLLSSVPGDDQVLAQVRAAVETAREAETADPLIEALFRAAVAAGKRVKTSAGFSRDRSSVAEQAVEEIAARLAPLSGKRALVIGNGTIGILVAAGLLERGCAVAMTLRDPRRKIALPQGCAIVGYDERRRALAGRDLVVSATSSPDFTLAADDLRGAESPPELFVDLAVPRDIDPDIALRPGTVLLNVDDLRGRADDNAALRRRRAAAEGIIREEAERFELWRRSRRRYAASDAGAPDFPVFINLHQVPVLIAGGGRVAARRAEKLLAAGALVRVVSPALCAEMEKLLDRAGDGNVNDGGNGGGSLRWTREEYAPRHMDGVTLAIAATDRREVNAAVGADARARGVLVSVADNSRECTFYFPAIVKSDFLTAGLVSNNGDHLLVKRAAARIRTEMEAIDADCQSGKPRE